MFFRYAEHTQGHLMPVDSKMNFARNFDGYRILHMKSWKFCSQEEKNIMTPRLSPSDPTAPSSYAWLSTARSGVSKHTESNKLEKLNVCHPAAFPAQ